MKQVTIKLFGFKELSEEAQQKAIQNYADINVDFDWWDFIYMDAENCNIEIEAFDIYRGEIKIQLIQGDWEETATKIIESHRENTKTYKLAKYFIANLADLENQLDGKDYDDDYYNIVKQISELKYEFQKDLAYEYLKILEAEYEYLTSEESIRETLVVNDYDFTEGGKIY